LVLAQATGGRSCVFVPRVQTDGQRNSVRLERRKDKLGNRSTASAEVEFQVAVGWRLGEEGEGILHILKKGGMTRLDCALGSHGLIRRAFSVAIYHAQKLQDFGKQQIEQPLMRQTLSRMALSLEGQTSLLFRLARAWEQRRVAKEAVW
ncbi:acyl-CoA dehydrogenase family protein, partial [Salmonella enterica]|uniref:acyl-CoA dehydrogenase family protein n=1 Tax=Salmonella enterica TaxID=28901 RepID=UPI003F4B7067